MTKIFKIPFATQGDKTVVPIEIQTDGSVSYTQGYGYDYERDQVTDPRQIGKDAMCKQHKSITMMRVPLSILIQVGEKVKLKAH